MAYPTGYTKYQEITIDHTKVSADLTDYVVYVNLADLVKAGADIFDLCRSDGGDIRATKSDGTTQLATELVVIDTTAKTGELHVKFTGTLSSTVDTIIRIYYNGTDTALATSDTYGRDAVWSNEISVYHMQTSSTDSKGSYNGTDTSISYSTNGQIGKGAYTAGGKVVTSSYSLNSAFSLRLWINPNSVSGVQVFFSTYKPANGTGSPAGVLQLVGTALNYSNYVVDTNQGSFSASTLAMAGVTHNGTTATLYKNGASIGSGTVAHSTATAEMSLFARNDVTTNRYAGLLDEVRLRSGTLATSWITTEYNNQSSPSTFYASSDEQGGTTNVTVNPSALVATFSLPASTVTAVRTVSTSVSPLTATFSLPAPAISGGSLVSASPLVATFSLPTSNVITPDSYTIASVLVGTFSLPSVTITAEKNSSTTPSVLSATFSLPAPTVTLGVAITVTPAVLNATFSTPAPTITVISNMSVSPSPLVATFSLPVSRVLADFWENKFPVASDPFVDKVYNAGDNWQDKY